MRIATLFLTLTIITVNISNGQVRDNSQRLSFGSLYSDLVGIKWDKQEELKYKPCKDFDFGKFLPTTRDKNPTDKFKLGYNAREELREIVIQLGGDSTKLAKFIIHEFKNHRILVCQRNSGPSGEFMFMPSVIVLEKSHLANPQNFMLTLTPLWGEKANNILMRLDSEQFLLGTFEDISAIMFLDNELNAKQLLKLDKSRIVFNSQIFYRDSSLLVEKEEAKFYFCSNEASGLNIKTSTFFDDLIYLRVSADLELTLHPRQTEISKNWPLWFFSGGHDYGE